MVLNVLDVLGITWKHLGFEVVWRFLKVVEVVLYLWSLLLLGRGSTLISLWFESIHKIVSRVLSIGWSLWPWLFEFGLAGVIFLVFEDILLESFVLDLGHLLRSCEGNCVQGQAIVGGNPSVEFLIGSQHLFVFLLAFVLPEQALASLCLLQMLDCQTTALGCFLSHEPLQFVDFLWLNDLPLVLFVNGTIDLCSFAEDMGVTLGGVVSVLHTLS